MSEVNRSSRIKANGRGRLDLSPTPSTLLNQLLGYYRFENDLTDSSGNGNTLPQYSGTANYTTGKLNQGVTSDGVTNQLYLTGLLSGSGDFSFAGWIYPDALGTELDIYDTSESVAISVSFQIILDTATPIVTESASTPIVGSPLSKSNWYHVCVIVTGGDKSLYIDGALIGTVATGLSDPYALYIVTDTTNVMDEIAVWERALTTEEVAELYNSGNGFDPTI